jgi:hypothetical protein
MADRDYGKTEIKVTFAGREYGLIRGRWENGSAGLLLQNPETGGVFPVSIMGGPLPRGSNDAFVPDVDGLVDALEKSGVLRSTSFVTTVERLKVRRCELIHPELIRPNRTNDVTLGESRDASQENLLNKTEGRDR